MSGIVLVVLDESNIEELQNFFGVGVEVTNNSIIINHPMFSNNISSMISPDPKTRLIYSHPV